MSQYAVVLIHLDADGESWGPFRSYDRASEVYDEVVAVYGGDTSDIRLEHLQEWPGKRSFRREHHAGDGEEATTW